MWNLSWPDRSTWYRPLASIQSWNQDRQTAAMADAELKRTEMWYFSSCQEQFEGMREENIFYRLSDKANFQLPIRIMSFPCSHCPIDRSGCSLTFDLRRLESISKSVVSEIPPWTTKILLLIKVPRGKCRYTWSINFSKRSALWRYFWWTSLVNPYLWFITASSWLPRLSITQPGKMMKHVSRISRTSKLFLPLSTKSPLKT